eukprot:m.10206 g.10206  ORF g.10206 m.10206 type:complete len:72 (-) comp3067_c0_seq1:215-430(-)
MGGLRTQWATCRSLSRMPESPSHRRATMEREGGRVRGAAQQATGTNCPGYTAFTFPMRSAAAAVQLQFSCA